MASISKHTFWDSKLVLAVLFICWLLAMCGVGIPLTLHRQLSVDEFHTAFETHLLTTPDPDAYIQAVLIYRVPLSWLTGQFDRGVDILNALRIVFFVLYLVLCILIATVQPYFTSWRGRLLVLLGVSTVYPLWYWGSELRHDTVIVLMQPILYWVTQRFVRSRRVEKWPVILAGCVCVWMQSSAIKSAVYWVPWAVGLVLLALWIGQRKWDFGRMIGWLAAGFMLGIGMLVSVLIASGNLTGYLDGIFMGATMYGNTSRFSAWVAVHAAIEKAPQVWTLALLSIVLCTHDAIRLRQWPPARSLVTFGFALWSLIALHINPNPYGYNVIHPLTFAFFLALDGVDRLLAEAADLRRKVSISLVIAMVLLSWMPWRCDVVLLVGQLVLFIATLQVLTQGYHRREWLAAAGATCIVLQLFSYHSAVYWVPYALLLLSIIALRSSQSVVLDWRPLVRAFLVGFLAATILMPLIVMGKVFQGFLYADWPKTTLDWFPFVQYHAFVYFPAAAINLVILSFPWTITKTFDDRDPLRPARMLLACAYIAWVVLLWELGLSFPRLDSMNLLVFVFFLLIDVGFMMTKRLSRKSSIDVALLLVISILVVISIGYRDPRNWQSNATQFSYIEAAEALTDPVDDTVLDGVGIVPTRRPPLKDWYVAGLLLPEYGAGIRTPFRKIMLDDPSPVVITNYRWKWRALTEERQILEQRYIPIDTQFHVLGGTLSEREGTFDIHRSGRYRFDVDAGGMELWIDGKLLSRDLPILRLEKGSHTMAMNNGQTIRYYWVGPRLDELPTISPPLGKDRDIVLVPVR